jgi:hypothetical protein
MEHVRIQFDKQYDNIQFLLELTQLDQIVVLSYKPPKTVHVDNKIWMVLSVHQTIHVPSIAIFSATDIKVKKTIVFSLGGTCYYYENNTQAEDKSMSIYALHSSTRL